MKKFQAIAWALFTVVIAIIGFSGYSAGTHYMTWFGIELSENGFILLIIAFAVSDIFVLKNAFAANDKFGEEMKNKAVETVNEANKMEIPCTVTLTRLSNLIGAAMGVRVFLNGTDQGVLKNGKTIVMQTWLIENELIVRYNADDSVHSAKFNAAPGGNVYITLKYVGGQLLVKDYYTERSTKLI
ncbi:MAG: hypothetical protein LBC19_11335 [Tannerella sp.]|jgi:hypothetical protein|nr:hypothetical protein [Tannerella sp.]